MGWTVKLPAFICFILFIHYGEGRGQYHHHPPAKETLAWYDAYLKCQSKDHSLYVPIQDDFSDLTDLLPGDGTLMWLGGRYVHTDWRWADGCGVESGMGCVQTSDLMAKEIITSNSPFDCLVKCGTQFVALQNTTCMCLKYRPETNLQPVSCNLRCAGNFDRSCGGANASSVYTAVNSGKFRWDFGSSDLDDDCAHLYYVSSETPSLDNVKIRTDSCGALVRQYKMSLCQKCDPDSQNCTVFKIGAVMTWQNAEAACRERGLELLTVLNDSVSIPLDAKPYTPENYWIGLRRHFLLKWINGSEVSRPEIRTQGGFCLAARLVNSSQITVITVNCSTPLPYSCEIGNYSTMSPDTASELLSSSACYDPNVTSGIGVTNEDVTSAIPIIHGGNTEPAETTTKKNEETNTGTQIGVSSKKPEETTSQQATPILIDVKSTTVPDTGSITPTESSKSPRISDHTITAKPTMDKVSSAPTPFVPGNGDVTTTKEEKPTTTITISSTGTVETSPIGVVISTGSVREASPTDEVISTGTAKETSPIGEVSFTVPAEITSPAMNGDANTAEVSKGITTTSTSPDMRDGKTGSSTSPTTHDTETQIYTNEEYSTTTTEKKPETGIKTTTPAPNMQTTENESNENADLSSYFPLSSPSHSQRTEVATIDSSTVPPDNVSNMGEYKVDPSMTPTSTSITSRGGTGTTTSTPGEIPPREEPADDLIPLYILLGILGGMLFITAVIVFAVFRYRSARHSARLRAYRDTLSRRSLDRLTERDRDDEFIFVENSGYQQSR